MSKIYHALLNNELNKETISFLLEEGFKVDFGTKTLSLEVNVNNKRPLSIIVKGGNDNYIECHFEDGYPHDFYLLERYSFTDFKSFKSSYEKMIHQVSSHIKKLN